MKPRREVASRPHPPAHVDWALYEHPEPNHAPVTALPESFHSDFPIEHEYQPFLNGRAVSINTQHTIPFPAHLRRFVPATTQDTHAMAPSQVGLGVGFVIESKLYDQSKRKQESAPGTLLG